MKRKRFSEEQIIGVLSEATAGATAVEVCRRHGISETTFYRWKAKLGGMAVSDARRLRQLEVENTRLKRLLADAHLSPSSPTRARSSRCRSWGAGRRSWIGCWLPTRRSRRVSG